VWITWHATAKLDLRTSNPAVETQHKQSAKKKHSTKKETLHKKKAKKNTAKKRNTHTHTHTYTPGY
jgi:ABC-type nickel/cobalt efflux system permease component RcnA